MPLPEALVPGMTSAPSGSDGAPGVTTTQIDTHVLQRCGSAARRPMDALVAGGAMPSLSCAA